MNYSNHAVWIEAPFLQQVQIYTPAMPAWHLFSELAAVCAITYLAQWFEIPSVLGSRHAPPIYNIVFQVHPTAEMFDQWPVCTLTGHVRPKFHIHFQAMDE